MEKPQEDNTANRTVEILFQRKRKLLERSNSYADVIADRLVFDFEELSVEAPNVLCFKVDRAIADNLMRKLFIIQAQKSLMVQMKGPIVEDSIVYEEASLDNGRLPERVEDAVLLDTFLYVKYFEGCRSVGISRYSDQDVHIW